ncbi:MAG: tetratricopeptide repeat protein, partial [Proteobacteria bacterium]|nr:tetratricopeptide repeat protein [Pseudomonadota bacterium]
LAALLLGVARATGFVLLAPPFNSRSIPAPVKGAFAMALSLLLSENGVEHALLNATNDELEAKVIAEAGAPGRITIATPKGGRGVDFKLGGKGADDATKRAVIERGGLLVLGFALDSADGQYNLGNALAKAGEYQQAIKAYEEALERQPGMPDALANKRAVEAAMKRQPPQGQQPDPGAQPEPGQDGEPQPGEGEGESESGQPSPPQQGAPPQQTGQPPDEADPAAEADPADAEAQQAADAAQREAMQRALQQAQEQAQAEQAQPGPPPRAPETAAERERRLANEAWLQRVPDDPGGLLREKFRIEYERRQLRGDPGE